MGPAPRAMVSVVSVSIEFSYLVSFSVTDKKGKKEKWYFVSKIVLTNCEKKKCSSNREKLLILKPECREFAKLLRSLEQFI